MTTLQPDELEDQLFLAMLRLSRRGIGPDFDLVEVCRSEGLAANSIDIARFVGGNHGTRGHQNVTLKSMMFSLTAGGRRHALELEKSRRPKGWRDRFTEIPVGKGLWDLLKISLGFGLGLLTHKLTGS